MASLFKMIQQSENENTFVIFRDLRAPAIRTETTSPYTAIIPDMTTGMSDYSRNRLAYFEQHLKKTTNVLS